MAQNQRDVKNRIGSIKNIQKITRAMEMVAAALLLVTGDRGLAGAFNTQIVRAGVRSAADYEAQGRRVSWYASGRRGVSSLTFRGRDVVGAYTGFTDRPAYADARRIADDLIVAYSDNRVD